MIRSAEEFIASHTVATILPFIPEITLHLAAELTPIWSATEAWLFEHNVDPPYWAFAWPGGQVLARYILDHPTVVRGRRILDFAAGCGIAAIACAMAGAAHVDAAEIDGLAVESIRLNARRNHVDVSVLDGDIVGMACRWDLILCGDICYEAPMTRHIMPWLRRVAQTSEVWIADPGRAYRPDYDLELFFSCDVPTIRELEDKDFRTVGLYRVTPDSE